MYPNHAPPQPAPKKRKKVFFWIFLGIQVLFLIWVIAGISQASGSQNNCQYLSAKDCNNASDAGTAIGVFLIVIFWAFVDFILGVSYLLYRLARKND